MPPAIAALGAIGGAMGAAAGTAATLAGVSAVGMGLSVVGKLTGNEDMMKVGGVMGLAGGIGSLATGAMGAAGAAEAVGGLDAAGMAGIGLGEAGTGGISSLTSNLSDSGDMFGQAAESGTNGSETGAVLNPDVQTLPRGILSQPGNGYDAPFNSPPQAFTQDVSVAGQGAQNGYDVTSNATSAALGVTPPANADSSWYRDLWNKMDDKTKQAVITGGIQAGGNALGGMFAGWTAEQKLALEREKQNTMQSNASAQPVVKFGPPKTGILNAPRMA